MEQNNQDCNDLMFSAVSFAARAHRHQLRKDGETPYAAHPFRVCLVVRHIFGIEDPKVLTAALLHDTIEDTPADYDDIESRFGQDVANWVADLTKDMRQADDPREDNYCKTLSEAPWPVIVCKLADLYDNLSDSEQLPILKRKRTLMRSKRYLNAMRSNIAEPSRLAFQIVEQRLAHIERQVYQAES